MAKFSRDQNSGIRKAAILLMSLGQDVSSSVLRHLPESAIQKISLEIANLESVEPAVSERVTQEFMELVSSRQFVLDGGLDYARNLLNKALGSQRAKGIIDTLSQLSQSERPFALARKAEPHLLSSILMNEHPQTIALILCYLQPDKSAMVLAELPEHVRTDVARRVATIHSASPTVVLKIEQVLDGKLANVVDNTLESVGGVRSLVEILNAVDRSTEKKILDDLDAENPDLAEQIRLNLFIFEDIISLDRAAIQRVIREVSNEDLTLALKGASAKVASMIYSNISKRAAETLKDDIEFLGPVRLSAVEEAQKKIVGIIRRLDEAGEIIMGRSEDDALIL